MKTVKRLLSLFLVMAMVFSCLPTSVFSAESQVGSGAVQEALQNVEALAPTEETVAQLSVQEEEFQFVEPGKENDAPVGDVIITDSAYRIQLNPDLSSYTILEYMGSAANVVIPSEYNGLPITRIGAYAFQGKTRITTVSIPETVTRMEEGVFEGCKRLSYHVYEGGKYLGSPNNPYYYYCGPENTALTEVTMHADTKLVAAFAFRGCDSLKTVTVPDGVIQVGYGMLFGCDVESVTLPFVGEMGTAHNGQFGWAFGARSMGGNISYVPLSLKNVVITGGATIIQGAFYGVDMLESITLPYLGGSIGSTSNTFLTYYWGADSYTQNILPESLKSFTLTGGKIKDYAFYNCIGLEKIVIESEISSIGLSVFYGCVSLQAVSLPETVVSIGTSAFSGCVSLSEITLPGGLKTIERYAFNGCSSLLEIEIPYGVSVIRESVFSGCSSMQSVTIPSSVTSVEHSAFYGCQNISRVCISDLKAWCQLSLKNTYANPMRYGATLYLNGQPLTSITVPEGTSWIREYAFQGCAELTQVILPEGLLEIGDYAFADCTELEMINLPDSVQYIRTAAFSGCKSLKEIVVPDAVKYIQQNAFSGCSSLSKLVLSENLISIYANAFSQCSSLPEITLPESLTTIEQYAFSGCSSLQSVTIPENVSSMGSAVFSECSALKTVTFLNSMTALSSYMFSGCGSLQNIVWPHGLSDLGTYTFQNSGLKEFVLPSGVTSIGSYVFRGCKYLAKITFHDSLTTIGTYAFSSCINLTEITLPASLTSIGRYAFQNCPNLGVVTNNSSLSLSIGSTGNGYVAYYVQMLIDKSGNVTYRSSSANPSYITTADGFRFLREYQTSYTLVAYVGSEDTVTLPTSINGYSYEIGALTGVKHLIIPGEMTEITAGMFMDCTELVSVTLSDGITTIGGSAFSGCTGLTNVSIPDSVTDIGSYAFYNCSSLQQITIPDGVQYIFEYTFCGCSSLTQISIPDSLLAIGEYAFNGCSSLESLTLPEAVNEIRMYAFGGCSSLTDMNIPDAVTTLTYGLFADCTSLTGVEIPNGVTVIEGRVFTGCGALQNVTLPDGLLTIGHEAFRSCYSMIEIRIPSGVHTIGADAFAYCSLENVYIVDLAAWSTIAFGNETANPMYNAQNLYIDGKLTTEVSVPDGVEAISNYAFVGAAGVAKIIIPASVGSVAAKSFSKSTSIEISQNNSSLQMIDGIIYDAPITKILFVTGQLPSQVVIAEGVTTIEQYTFQNCDSMVSLTLPDSVTTVSSYAFYGFAGLSSINIPDNVSAIGQYAFYDCSNLEKITFMGGVASIGQYAFGQCSNLHSVYIHDLKAWCSVDYYSSYTNPLQYGGSLYIDGQLASEITIPEGVTSIGRHVFYGSTGISHITLPSSMTSIADYGFEGCKGLVSVSIPDSVSYIGASAFKDCTALTDVVIPDSVTRLGASAFAGCSALKFISIPQSITYITASAFENCSRLTQVDLPDSLTYIYGYAFRNCACLNSITIPESMRVIYSYAFSGCSKLYKVTNNSSLSLTMGSSGNGSVAYYAKMLVDSYGDVTYKNASAGFELIDTAEGFRFVKENGSYTLVAYLGEKTSAVLPADINGAAYTISSVAGADTLIIPASFGVIKESMFQNCIGLKNVVISEGITTIEKNAFAGSDISSISIAQTVTTIGDYAFSGCSGLTSVTLPESLDTIGQYAFQNCNWLSRVEFPDSMSQIGAYAFYNCISLTAIELPQMVYVKDYAFKNCSRIAYAVINGVGQLGSNVFEGCTGLTVLEHSGEYNEWRHMVKSADWNSGMTEYTLDFGEDTGLLYETDLDRTEFYLSGVNGDFAEVTPPAYYSGRPVTAVLSNAFGGNETVQAITLPETVTYIGENAFVNCTALESMVFPESLTEMQRGVLSGCDSLQSLALPFLGKCREVNDTSYLGYTFGAYSYKENASYLPGALTSVTVTDVDAIGDHAFYDCMDLETVNLPDTVTAIGEAAFSGCMSMEEISLPQKLETIGSYAFSGCSDLSAIILPDSVTKVGEMLLDGCNSLTDITIGAGLAYSGIADLGNGNPLFGIDKSASRLKTYLVAAGNPDFTAIDNILYHTLTIDGVPVPVEIVDAPAQANLRNYDMPELIVKIGAYAFAYNNTLRGIDLNYVRMIGNNAFYKAENLIYANFGTGDQEVPAGVDAISYSQYVGDQAFMGCTALQTVNLDSEMLIGIGEDAFADCAQLTSIELGKNIQSLGIGAFGSSGSGGSNLEEFWVDPDNSYLESIDGVLYQENSDGTLTLLVYPAMSYAYTEEDGKSVFHVPTERVTGIESYAFRMSQNLDTIYVQPENPTKVGDYAFANSKLERVYIGENVTSLGLKRGEGEYTVFSECDYLVAVEVEAGNSYYSSESGVLFDKNQTKLIKYPAARAGSVYEVPETVNMIASMAFKDNSQLKYVWIRSQVDTVGLEAFYGCTGLSLIFFDRVYAPTAVLENAFTTYDSLNEDHMANPRTQLGYSEGYYQDGAGYGWKNYEDVYDLTLCQALPEQENRGGSGFYSVVVVDSQGRRIDKVHVTLTDPNGVSETVATGDDGSATGVAMFYDLFEAVGMGFAVTFDGNYSLKVSDPDGEYFTYVNPSFYLDEDMRITYVTLTQLPSIYGTTCGEVDINTEGAEINKAEYGYSNVELIDQSLGYVEGNIKTTPVSEYMDISVIAYCDSRSGWSFVDENGQLLDENGGLYQNGRKICDVTDVQVGEDSVLFTFRVDVAALVPEVEIEARLTAFDAADATYTCSTVLNIHVFDFIVTEDDVDLDTQELEIDLAAENATLAKLFGSPSIDVSLGKNLSFGVAVDGSRVEMTLGGEYSKSADKSSVGIYSDYEEGYDKNHGANNSATYFFQFTDLYIDNDGKVHTLTYNVRFARYTEKSNYFYYRCYVYEGAYKNEVAEFYGAVNGLGDTAAKLVGAKTYRERLAPKAYLIYLTHLATANKEADSVDKIKKLEDSAIYIEAIAQAPAVSNSHTFDVALNGKLVFEYDRTAGLKPVSSEIHGELYYTFKHNSQFVVWVIPVVLEVEVKVGGEVDITLKFDENRKVSMEEAKLTLSAAISAKVGVGCSVASVGVYGSIGTVFILDFYPEFGVDSWTLNGEIGAYMKILWYTKKFTLAKFQNVELMSSQEQLSALQEPLNSMYLVENYSSEDLGDCDGDARIIALGDQIYKVFYVDASNRQGYDAYNYRKLAVALWNGSDWESPVILDDNGHSDASYQVYSADGQSYIVYTQQSSLLDEASVDDTYASAANMVVKAACITDPANITVSTVADGEFYKYLSALTLTEDGLMAVWAENTDNNMFGVSPYNYIDANGTSHVFETTANAIYTSKLVDGLWQAPVCVSAGLSAVTDLAVAEDGSICYILDENGDLGDSQDRILYSVTADAKTVSAENKLSTGSVTGVEAADDGFVYYLSSADDSVDSGLYALSLTGEAAAQLPRIANMTDNYKILYAPSGEAVAVFYTALKTWQERDTTVDGSAMYAVFCQEGVWSQPVEIDAFPAESDVYISYFDVLYLSEDSVMLMADFVNRDGVKLYSLTEAEYQLLPKLTVEGHAVDYVEQVLDITVTNSGAGRVPVYVSVDGNAPVAYGDGLGAGATAVISVSLSDCDSLQPVVEIYDGTGREAIHTISDIDLQYSDVRPLVKQLLLGQENNLLVAVKNTGNMANGGYLLVRSGNYDAQTMDVDSLLAAVDTDALTQGTVVSAMDPQGKTFWVASLQAESGSVQYFEIPLTEETFAGTEGLLTVYTSVTAESEKGEAADNNITYASYQALTGVLAEGQTASAVPELTEDQLELDIKTQESVSTGFSCGEEDSVALVTLGGAELIPDVDYAVEFAQGQGTLTLLQHVFTAAGEHSLTVTFTSGQSCELTVTVPAYHTITWVADGVELCTTQVKAGDIPYITTVPERDSSQNKAYVFAGWSQNPDGSDVGTKAAAADTTYYAVWSETAKQYNITWVLQSSNGAVVQVQESYTYNEVPAYKGILPEPNGKLFAGWDQELTPVTADATYTAQYGSIAVYENGVRRAGYLTLAAALESYDPASQYIKLLDHAAADAALRSDLYIDLAGFDLTGNLEPNGYAVYGMDSATDSYSSENMGSFRCTDAQQNPVVPERHVKTDLSGSVKRYLAIEGPEGWSFHRFYLGITHTSLSPSVTGIGYKAVFCGDDMVRSQLDSFGYGLWLTGGRVVTRTMGAEQFVSGREVTLRLKNIPVDSFAQEPVNAQVFLQLRDGTALESAEYAYSLRQLVELVNDHAANFENAQLQAVRAMIEAYPVMKDWNVSRILERTV